MKHIQVLIAISLLGQTAATADMLQLKNGAKIEGTFLSGNTHTIQFIGNDGKSKSYSLADVDQVTFAALPPPPRRRLLLPRQWRCNCPLGPW